MSLIQIEQLEKSFLGQRVFAPFSIRIERGDKIALVGDNGTGKSTLLSIIAGTQEPSKGTIHRARKIRIGHLPQLARLKGVDTLYQAMQRAYSTLLEMEGELREIEREMAHSSGIELQQRYDELLYSFGRQGGYKIDAEIRSVLTGVGFSGEEFDRPVETLSGGEEARAALARVLLEGADILLLDEPTNHLDFAALDWLEETLLSHSGALILVSHDRHLLDRVANQTWELSFGRFSSYGCGYTESRALRSENRRRRSRQYERQQAYIQRQEEFVRRQQAGQKHRQAKDREKKIARAKKGLVAPPQEAKRMHMDIPIERASGRLVLTMKGLQIGFSSSLVSCPDLCLYRGERVAVIGKNGCGKTTLLRTLSGQLPPLGGKVIAGHNVEMATYSQTQEGLCEDGSILGKILSQSNLSISQARALLARFLFEGDTVTKELNDLSGGERSRLALALLSLMRGNLLLLDEPTNHLDLPSQEILEGALLSYEGTIILVTHDRALLRALATQIWGIKQGHLRAFAVGYEDYKNRLIVEGKKVKAEPKKKRPAKKRAQRQKDKARVDIDALEREIEGLEDSLRRVEKGLIAASSTGNQKKITRLGKEHQRLNQKISELYTDWEKTLEGD
jgi:ATP-binding cassette subfamily F protein 3